MSHTLFQAIKDTTDSYSVAQYPIQVASDQLILKRLRGVFEKGHTVYCFFRYREMFEKHKQLIEEGKGDSLAGGVIGLLAAEYDCSSLIIYGLIIKCIDDLFNQHLEVFKAYKSLKGAITPKRITFKESEHQRSKDVGLILPPSIHLRFEQEILPLYRQCVKIIRCWLRLLWQIIKLSFITRDIYLITTPGSQARLRACTELATTILQHKDKLVNDSEFLKQELTKRVIQLNEILRKVEAPEVPDSLLNMTLKTAEHIPSIFEVWEGLLRQNNFYRAGKIHSVTIGPPQRGQAPSLNPSSYTDPKEQPQNQQKLKFQKKMHQSLENVQNQLDSFFSKHRFSWFRK